MGLVGGWPSTCEGPRRWMTHAKAGGASRNKMLLELKYLIEAHKNLCWVRPVHSGDSREPSVDRFHDSLFPDLDRTLLAALRLGARSICRYGFADVRLRVDSGMGDHPLHFLQAARKWEVTNEPDGQSPFLPVRWNC